MRYVDDSFIAKHLVPLMEEDSLLSSVLSSLPSKQEPQGELPPGVEVISGRAIRGSDSDDEVEAQQLIGLLVESMTEGAIDVPTPGGGGVAVDKLKQELATAANDAADEARAYQRREDMLEAPVRDLRRANRLVEKAADGYHRVVDDGRFNRGDFRYQVGKLVRAVGQLKKAVG